MKLYIIRHGETSWNAEGRLQGQTDIPLNENGIRLAKITCEALKEVPFDLAISSPLKRASKIFDVSTNAILRIVISLHHLGIFIKHRKRQDL